MEKYLVFYIGLFISVSVFAQSEDSPVTMVSYSQPEFVGHGEIYLRNNTNEWIRDIAYQIIYYDMDNNELDTRDFEGGIVIEPGHTKRITTPLFSYSGYNTRYYLDENRFPFSDFKAFKVNFKLKAYNKFYKKYQTAKKELSRFADSPVSMVSYSQLSISGGVSLKNNTDEEVHDVSFRLIYCDMDGNELERRDLTERINIPSGNTGIINVPSFDGCYFLNAYYMSNDISDISEISGESVGCESLHPIPHSFKVNYEFLAYNELYKKDLEEARKERREEILYLIIGIGLACGYCWRYMRKKKEEECDRNWINLEASHNIASLGDDSVNVIVWDTRKKRNVAFFFFHNAAKIKINEAVSRNTITLNYDEIVDCYSYKRTIVGETVTKAETTTDWGMVNIDPNATITSFSTSKSPDVTNYYIKITTSNLAIPILIYGGTEEAIYKLESLIKIAMRAQKRI